MGAEGNPRWQVQRTSFGDCADAYDAYRPDWPSATARWLTGTEEGGPLVGRGRLRVADVGAGTGKLTRVLVDAGHDVAAVEPSDGMIEVLRRAVPKADVRAGSAERLPLADRSVDAITVAQAWHWFDAEAAFAECARVLRPGGVLGIGWHVKDQQVPWVRELMAPLDPPSEIRTGAAPDLETVAGFTPFERRTFRYEQRLDPAGLAALASSWSYVAVHEDRDQVLADVAALGARVAGPDGYLLLPHETRCYRAVRLEGATT